MRIKRGSICFYDFRGTGSVQKGYRPCLVVSNNKANHFSKIITVLPITSKPKHNLPTHMRISLEVESIVLAEQITTVEKDKLELSDYYLSEEQMKEVDRCMRIQLAIEHPNSQARCQKLEKELQYYKTLVLGKQNCFHNK